MIDPNRTFLHRYSDGSKQFQTSFEMDGLGRRYIFGFEREIDQIVFSVFEKAFEKKRNAIIAIAREMCPKWKGRFSKWNINLSIFFLKKGIALMNHLYLGSSYFTLMLYLITLLIFKAINKGVYALFSRMICCLLPVSTCRSLFSFVYGKSPYLRLKIFQSIWKTYYWIFKNRVLLLIFIYQTYLVLCEVKRPFFDRMIQWINNQSIFSLNFLSLCSLWDLNEECFHFAITILRKKGDDYLSSIFKQLREKNLAVQKEFCYSLWHRIIQAESG